MIAVRFGKYECVKKLLDLGDKVNQIDSAGRSPLQLACWFDHQECVRLILQYHPILDYQDNYGRTALHISSWFGGIQNCKVLLEAGANINIKDKFGWTPLHFAVKHRRSDITSLLLKHKADYNIQNANGITPKYMAEDCQELSKIFDDEEKRRTEVVNNDTRLENEFLEEHRKLKETILELLENEDSQARQFNALKEKYEKHHSSLSALQSHQNLIKKQVERLSLTIQNIAILVDNAYSGNLTEASQNIQVQSHVLPAQQTSQSISNSYICKFCSKNKAVMRCKQCRSPVCQECMIYIKNNGCPFCMNNTI